MGCRGWRIVPAFTSGQEVDATGAGDVFLAAAPRRPPGGGRQATRADQALAVAAAAASLAIEGIGVSRRADPGPGRAPRVRRAAVGG